MSENYANILSAGMGNVTEEEYVNQHDKVLSKIDTITQKANEVTVNTIEEFQDVMEFKGLVSSLWCYAFNNDKEDFEKVNKVEGILGRKLYKFATSYRKLSPEIRPIAKYLCWNKRFYREDIEKIIKEAFDNDIIRKKDGRYFIIGFHLAVGDNTFSISNRTGQQYRNYVKSCALQAVYMSFIDSRRPILEKFPIKELEEYYNTVSTGDHKHCVKINFNRKDKSIIYDKYYLR